MTAMIKTLSRASLAFALAAALCILGLREAQAQSSPSPVPAPSPSASPRFYDRFASVDLLLTPKVANAFAANSDEPVTQSLRAAFEFRFFGRSFAEAEYLRWIVSHPSGGYTGIANGTVCNAPGGRPPIVGNPGCVTAVGGATSVYVNAAQFREQDVIVNSSLIGLGNSINYIATSALLRSNNYGYPNLSAGFGIGAERLPDMRKKADISGYFYYYPELHGKYTLPNGSQVNLRYKAAVWRITGDLKVPKSPLFLQLGFIGDRSLVKENAPSNSTHSSLTLGFGGRF
jgi:hypothetical protein